MTVMEKIGARIRHERRVADMTQEQLGKMLGWDKSRVCEIEKGRKRLSVPDLFAIAVALKLKVRTLTDGAEEEVEGYVRFNRAAHVTSVRLAA